MNATRQILLTSFFVFGTGALAHADSLPANRDHLSPDCVREIQKAIEPVAIALTGDREATVGDQGFPLEETGKTLSGTPIYYKPMWKVVGDVDGFYHLNAGAYITLTSKSCDVVGIKIAPDTF